jgi:hypothetical protein
MTNFKSLTIWTIVLSFLVLLGLGHGIVCIGLMEVFSIFGILTGHPIHDEYFSWSLAGSYDQSIGAATLLTLSGQALLLISLFINGSSKIRLKLLGLLLLWFEYYYLIHNFINDSTSQLSLFSGIPFFISSGLLAYRMIKEKWSSAKSFPSIKNH